MSRTDKHRPVWVQLSDREAVSWRRERHDHRKGPCDLPQVLTKENFRTGWFFPVQCAVWESFYGYTRGMWPQPPIGGWGRPRRLHGRARTSLRMLRSETLKALREDVDLVDWSNATPTRKWLWHKQ